MNLFTRNIPYYHFLKYLLFLLKHSVYRLLVSVYCGRYVIHHKPIAVIVEALTVNVWGAIPYMKWLNKLVRHITYYYILMLQGMLHLVIVENNGNAETIFPLITKRLALQCNETVNITSWQTWAVNCVQHLLVYSLFCLALQPSAGYGLLVHEVSWSHTTTRHSR
jgi:hypothetical protein